MKIALVRNTKIVEFVDAPFPVHADLTFVDVDDDTTLQDSFVNGEVVKKAQHTLYSKPPTGLKWQTQLCRIQRKPNGLCIAKHCEICPPLIQI